MAAITADGRQELVALFLTMFNRTPTTLELAQMVVAREAGATLVQVATTLAAKDEFALVASKDAESFANYLADQLLAADTPAAARAWGINWVITNVQGSKTKAQVIAEAVQALRATSNTNYTTAKAALTADVTAALEAIDNPPQPIVNLVLTNGADVLTGNNGADSFVATEATLSSADILTGGAGTDTLRYASSGNAAVNESGFETNGIEIVQVTADAVGGTTFDTTGITGLATLRNSNSSEDITLTGMGTIAAVELVAVGSAGATANDPTPDTTLIFNAAVVAGTADSLSVTLNGNLNVDGSGVGDLTANGIETINVATTGSASSLAEIKSTSLTKLVVTGDQNLTLATATFADTVNANVIDASAATGNVRVSALNSGAVDVAFTGGSGNDYADFSAGWDKDDSLTGGAGTDTIGLTNAVAIGILSTNAGTVSGVEVLNVTTAGTGVIDMDNFSGVASVIYDAGLTTGATATVDDAKTGIVVEVDVLAQGSANLAVDLLTDGSADTITVTFDDIAAGDAVGTVTVDDAETLNVSADDDSVAGDGTLTVGSLALTDTTALNISGDSDITVTFANVATPALKTLDASTATGKVSLTGADLVATGATIKLGSSDDTLNLTGSAGAGVDTITLGAGKDRVVYEDAAQSQGTAIDIITDFVSGTDSLDLTVVGTGAGLMAGVVTGSQFLGTVKTFADATSALSGGGTSVQAIFVSDEQAIFIDIDGDGKFGNADMQIELTGVTSLTAADMGLTSTGGTITLSATGAVVDASTKTGADANTTNAGDTIKGTVAQINGITTLDGLAGTDTLQATDAGAITVPAGVTNVEGLTLANGVNTVGLTATSIKSITGGTGADTVTLTNLAAGGAVSLGDGDDVLLAGTEAIIEATGSTFVGGAGTDSITFAAMAATTLSLSKVSGFETIIMGNNTGAVTLQLATGVTSVTVDTTTAAQTISGTGAQLTALTALTQVGGGNDFNLTVTDSGATVDLTDITAVTTTDSIDVITFTGNNNTLKVDAANIGTIDGTVVAAGTGDTLSTDGSLTVTDNLYAAFENITLATAGTVVEADADKARTITGSSGNDVITLGGNVSAAKTVALAAGGTDEVEIEDAQAGSAVVTVTGFTAGAGGDIIDIDTGTAITALAGIVIDGASANPNAAGAIASVLILGHADYQINGALTATTDAGVVEAAMINAQLALADQTATEMFYVVMDNGTDTGIYRVTVAATAGTAGVADAPADFSITLVGQLSGIADANTLVAANFV